jgi:tRNA modification GTPase
MLTPPFDDTIIAISTPPGFGGIGIVRLSGDKALPIAKKIFRPKKRGIVFSPRKAIFGYLYDSKKDEIFDEAYLIYFPGPYSYTREDIVEISCHGSPAVLEEAVRSGIRAGARHAHPGEFTLRAYLKGRIDIIQAEAVNDLIKATSLQQAKLAFGQVEGKLTKKVISFRQQLVRLLADIEASIEFPDENLSLNPKNLVSTFENMIDFLLKLVQSYDIGKSITDGLMLAITGSKNVGKSTLFNALLEEQRAIVTPYPGTTRDFLKEQIKIKDTIFNLVDMAGFGKPASFIEKEGIKKGMEIASQADGLLMLFDSSRKENRQDLALLQEYQSKKIFLIFNKIDLPPKMDIKKIKQRFKGYPSLKISALKGTNLDKLRENIYDVFAPKLRRREDIIFHLRQKMLLEESLRFLKKSLILLKEGYPEEVYAEEIRKIIPLIGQLTGEIRMNEVILNIFSRFCVGK